MQTSGKVSFINCVNEVSYSLPVGAMNNNGGIFIGNYIPKECPLPFSYVDCINRGTVTGGRVGFFFGNSSQASGGITLVDSPDYVNNDADHAAIYVSGCRNDGVIRATERCEAFISLSGDVNSEANTALAQKAGAFYEGTMTLVKVDDIGLLKSTDGKLTIKASETTEVASYVVNYSVSTSYKDANGDSMGSWYFFVTETVSSGEQIDFVTKVMLDTEYDATAEEGQKYADLSVTEGANKRRCLWE